MLIREITDADRLEEEGQSKKVVELKESGVCVTCEDIKHGNVFVHSENSLLYEDEIIKIMFETFPRREGHTIVIIKPHFEDISELPFSLSKPVMDAMLVTIHALKQALNCKKVYMVTMCDQGTTHLHFQLIPNYKGMKHGKHVFVSERMRYNYDKKIVDSVSQYITKNYHPSYNEYYDSKQD